MGSEIRGQEIEQDNRKTAIILLAIMVLLVVLSTIGVITLN